MEPVLLFRKATRKPFPWLIEKRARIAAGAPVGVAVGSVVGVGVITTKVGVGVAKGSGVAVAKGSIVGIGVGVGTGVGSGVAVSCTKTSSERPADGRLATSVGAGCCGWDR